jgi:hypothetical protein
MRRLLRWLLPALGVGQLLLLRTGILDGRSALVVGALLEGLILALAGRQLLSAWRAYRRERAAGLDVWAALEDGLAVLMPRTVARFAVLEPKLWYCLVRWASRRPGRPDSFGYQRRALIGPVLMLAILTLPAELLAVELLAPWTWLRIVLGVGSVYSLCWLAGFYASMRVLPHALEGARFRLRFGAFAEGLVPYAQIAGITLDRRRTPGGRDGLQVVTGAPVAYLGTGGRTDLTLHLKTPITVRGLRGATKPVTSVCLAADEPEALAQALAQRSGVAVFVASPAPSRSLWRNRYRCAASS